MKKAFKYIGELLVVIGGFIGIYNLFNFSHINRSFTTGLPVGLGYYYDDSTRLAIAIGFTLIIVGILLIKNKK